MQSSDHGQRQRALAAQDFLDAVAFSVDRLHVLDGQAALIHQCAEQGYAMNNEEMEIGVRSIAVPLYNVAGTAMGALSVSSRADRMTASGMKEQLLPVMIRGQSWVQRQLS